MDFNRSLFEGLRTAFILPFLAVFAVALGDFDMLRKYLTHADGSDIQLALIQLMVTGFVSGALWSLYSYRKYDATGSLYRSILGTGSSDDLARWYWGLEKDGRDLSVREATTSRCIPTADARWKLDDLINELSRPKSAVGSELLDRKVVQALGLKDKLLKPTQRVEDARQLLSLRYYGHQSQYQWDSKTVITESGYRAYVLVRQNESDGWMRCLVKDGPSAATAITIAAITRETWSFTT